MRPDPRLALAACLLLFFGVRLVLMVGMPTRLYEPEEYINLRLAAAVLGDADAWGGLMPPPPPVEPPGTPPAPLGAYQFQDFDGGTLAAAIVLIPIAAVLGLSVAAVKTGALLWTGLLLGLWLVVLGRADEQRGRLVGAAVFAFGPAPWVIASSVHWGNHAESAFGPPLVLAMGLLLAGTQRRAAAAAGLGLAAGAAIWFSQLNLLAGGLSLLAALLLGRTRPREWPLVAAGFVVGLLPRLLVLPPKELFRFGAHDRTVEDLVGGLLGGGWRWDELRRTWLEAPPLATWDFGGLGVFAWSEPLELGLRALIGLCLLLAVGGMLQRRPGRGVVLAVAVVATATVVLQPALLLAGGDFALHRLTNLYPLACAVVALGVLAAWRLHAVLGVALLLAWAVPNAAGVATLLSQLDPAEAPLTPWAWFSPPDKAVHERITPGIDGIDSDLIDELDVAMAQAFSLGHEDARVAVRGLGYGLGSDNTVFERRRLSCHQPHAPSAQSRAEAWGFGTGIALRCREQQGELAWCELTDPSLLQACAAGLRREPPPSEDPEPDEPDEPGVDQPESSEGPPSDQPAPAEDPSVTGSRP